MITRKTSNMYRPLNSVSTYVGILLLIVSPMLMSGISKQESMVSTQSSVTLAASVISSTPLAVVAAPNKLIAEAHSLYDSMKLMRVGLSKKAFEFAWKGYQY